MHTGQILGVFGDDIPKRNKVKFQAIRQHKLMFSVFIFSNLLLPILVVSSIFAREQFIDSLLVSDYMEQVLTLLIINLFLMFFIKYSVPTANRYVGSILAERIKISTDNKIARKKGLIPYHYHEDVEINNKFEVIKEATDQIWIYWRSVFGIMSALLSLVGVLFMLSKLGFFALFSLVLLFIPVLYFSIKAGTAYFDTWNRTSGLRRYCNYQKNVLIEKEHSKEKILFGFAPFFYNRWAKDYDEVRRLSVKEELRGSTQMQIAGVLIFIYIAVLTITLIVQLVNQEVSVGFVVSILSIVPMLITSLVESISTNLNSVSRAKKIIDELDDVLELDEESGSFELPARNIHFSKIEFRNVSFKYPGTSEWILRSLTMTFERGKHYAIVGENGAGKSTVIKLLLGLYRVTEGEILIDGKDINAFRSSEIKGLLSALFQDFQKYYNVSIAENIGVGDIQNINNTKLITNNAEKAKINHKIQMLPDSYRTLLGRMNDNGVELSGGEWQKLCIARLLMSPCPIKILDEPTASMDPIFEYELYRDFLTIMRDTTTVSISHRLASCRNSDYIYVIKNGSVGEQGSHKELMQLDGMYQNMFRTQQFMYK